VVVLRLALVLVLLLVMMAWNLIPRRQRWFPQTMPYLLFRVQIPKTVLRFRPAPTA